MDNDFKNIIKETLKDLYSIVGEIVFDNYSIKFDSYSNNSPINGEKLTIEYKGKSKLLVCVSCYDDTNDDEKEEGLSYNKCKFEIV